MTTTVAVVCTAGVCRSPFAAALLGERLQRRGVPAEVRAVGLRTVRSGVDARSVRALEALGVARPVEPARPLDRAALEVDLVIGMTRQHLREVVVLHREVFARAFTLRELVRRGDAHGARAPGAELHEWLAALHEGRSPATLLESSEVDDIADPVAMGTADYRAVTDEITELVDRLVELAWPRPAAGGPVGRTENRPATVSSAAPARGTRLRAARGRSVLVAGDGRGPGIEAALYAMLSEQGFTVRSAGGLDEGGAALAVAKAVAAGEAALGFCVGATGITSAVAANRVDGVTAAVVHDATTARFARRLGVNVVCLGAELVTREVAIDAVAAFVTAPIGDGDG
jgi:RpiB/LacA/LacB family sugar-phosphate isomerase